MSSSRAFDSHENGRTYIRYERVSECCREYSNCDYITCLTTLLYVYVLTFGHAGQASGLCSETAASKSMVKIRNRWNVSPTRDLYMWEASCGVRISHHNYNPAWRMEWSNSWWICTHLFFPILTIFINIVRCANIYDAELCRRTQHIVHLKWWYTWYTSYQCSFIFGFLSSGQRVA